MVSGMLAKLHVKMQFILSTVADKKVTL